MSTHVLLEGSDIQELLARVRAEHGTSARIIRAERIRSGGVGGFFARQRYEVTVAVDAGDASTDGGQVRPGQVVGDLALVTRDEQPDGTQPSTAGKAPGRDPFDELLAAADAAEVAPAAAAPAAPGTAVPTPAVPTPPAALDAAPSRPAPHRPLSTDGDDFAATLAAVRAALGGDDTATDDGFVPAVTPTAAPDAPVVHAAPVPEPAAEQETQTPHPAAPEPPAPEPPAPEPPAPEPEPRAYEPRAYEPRRVYRQNGVQAQPDASRPERAQAAAPASEPAQPDPRQPEPPKPSPRTAVDIARDLAASSVPGGGLTAAAGEVVLVVAEESLLAAATFAVTSWLGTDPRQVVAVDPTTLTPAHNLARAAQQAALAGSPLVVSLPAPGTSDWAVAVAAVGGPAALRAVVAGVDLARSHRVLQRTLDALRAVAPSRLLLSLHNPADADDLSSAVRLGGVVGWLDARPATVGAWAGALIDAELA